MATKTNQSTNLMSELPIDRLRDEAIGLGKALAQRGISRLGETMSGATGKLGDLADAAPGPGDVVKAAGKDVAKAAGKAVSPIGAVKGAASKVTDALPGGGGSDDDSSDSKSPAGDNTNLKVTNIVESIDVPVSRDVAYDLWTQFEEFPAFMKKVETVKQKKPEVVTWKAQVLWSHRTWTAKIVDQVPPEHIVWKSEGDKGRVDGAVTFHELAPDLTRVLVSLEYHPQGLFERTGNLWRAQGRRVRLELKHFRRHVANHALLHTEDVDGWEGEIHDGKVKPRRPRTAKKTSASRSSSGSSSSSSSGSSNGGGSTNSRSSGGAAKKSTARKSTARKSTARKSTAKKSPAKKAPASRSTAKKSPAKKSTSSRSTAKKASSGSTSKRTSAASKRTSTASARTSPSKRTAAKKSSRSSSSRSRTNRSGS